MMERVKKMKKRRTHKTRIPSKLHHHANNFIRIITTQPWPIQSSVAISIHNRNQILITFRLVSPWSSAPARRQRRLVAGRRERRPRSSRSARPARAAAASILTDAKIRRRSRGRDLRAHALSPLSGRRRLRRSEACLRCSGSHQHRAAADDEHTL